MPGEGDGRTAEERVADVRRLLQAARALYAARAALVSDIARTTGLTPAGVELGLESLETDASEDDLRALVASATPVPRVHVVLSANVFVAPLRALALAWAAASRVTVRPSSRDPVLTRWLVREAGDGAIALATERDVAAIDSGAIHVYGRDEAIAAVVARARVPVVAHGPGMGVAVVGARARIEESADRLAGDVVPFDQRGCLSPRIAFVEGPPEHGERFALALHESLQAWARRVPRGQLSPDERAQSVRWTSMAAFAGLTWTGADHAVALLPAEAALAVPPSGRHVAVAAVRTLDEVAVALAPFARYVVAVGLDADTYSEACREPSRFAPAGARVMRLGAMQRPPLDGPVDLRSQGPVVVSRARVAPR
jgi:hypothetical protein